MASYKFIDSKGFFTFWTFYMCLLS